MMRTGLGRFLLGVPPVRANGLPPSPRARYDEIEQVLLVPDPEREAAVRAVAARHSIDVSPWCCELSERKASTAELGEALANEGLLPHEWVDPRNALWLVERGKLRPQAPSVHGVAPPGMQHTSWPHEMAALALWAPELAQLPHDNLAHAARAWGCEVGDGVVLEWLSPHETGSARHAEVLSLFVMGMGFCQTPGNAATIALELDGMEDPPFLSDLLKSPSKDDPPQDGSPLGIAAAAVYYGEMVAMARARGLRVPDHVILHGKKDSYRALADARAPVIGKLFAEAPDPASLVAHTCSSGIGFGGYDLHGIRYLLRGLH